MTLANRVLPDRASTSSIVCVVGIAACATFLLRLQWMWAQQAKQSPSRNGTNQCRSIDACIGKSPLVYLEALSAATGCRILAKAEMLNPGGSIKDRVALQIIKDAEAAGLLQPGATVTEGTAGSTGVAFATVCAARDYRCHIFMPDDMAEEKAIEIQALGADVTRVRPVSISHPEHMVNAARHKAEELGGLFANQFENLSNYRAHLDTGREILQQCKGRVHAFVCGSGTGGTIAGVSHALKRRDPKTQIALVDPPGSSLFNKVTRGVLFSSLESEGRRLRNPFDTVTEGVGLNRLTANFNKAQIDTAVKCSDQEAVDMAQFLLKHEGLWVGSSSAVNCVGAVKIARQLDPGHTVVTILCDGGRRHLSKFHNHEYLKAHNLQLRHPDKDLSWIRKGS